MELVQDCSLHSNSLKWTPDHVRSELPAFDGFPLSRGVQSLVWHDTDHLLSYFPFSASKAGFSRNLAIVLWFFQGGVGALSSLGLRTWFCFYQEHFPLTPASLAPDFGFLWKHFLALPLNVILVDYDTCTSPIVVPVKLHCNCMFNRVSPHLDLKLHKALTEQKS